MKNRNMIVTVVLFMLACVVLLTKVQAVSPPPDGGYPGHNTAEGDNALFSLLNGLDNTAIGFNALYHDIMGGYNTATGFNALGSNTRGNYNTAIGWASLAANSFGSGNTATGFRALNSTNTNFSTANGYLALANDTGAANVAVGSNASVNATTGNNNVYIGANMNGVAGESNACYIASIFGQTSANGIPVLINSGNKLGTTTSSKRFKEDIKAMDKASEAILALKPVTFHYKKEIDPTGTTQFGLVAEEVEKVNSQLVVRDKEGKPYSVRYDQVNAMLLNEFLKEHRKVEDLEANAARRQKQIEALAAGLQKVSAQLESSKPAPQVVNNP